MDENHFTGRLKRYASVSTAATSFAARLVGEKLLGRPSDPDIQAHSLMETFGHLKGPAMKIVQFLATVPDAIPDVYAQKFLTLQSQAPAMGWSFVKRRMRAELGGSWETYFQDFSQEAVAAASLGQVHKATLQTGQVVACKLQYPDMKSCVEADIQQLKVGSRIFETVSSALRCEAIVQEIAQRLREELDYRLEADHSRLYKKIFNTTPWVHVPEVVPSLSTEHLLTMTWLEGTPLVALQDLSQEARNLLATRLFHAWYYPFYFYGIIHGDPHLGNYTFQEDHSINLLDFGCVRKFSSQFVKGVLTLFYALLNNRADQAVEAYEAWGFKELTFEKIKVLNLWARMLYEPLMNDRVRPIQKDHRGLEGRQMAEKVYQELKRLGGIHPPREFVFMDRAAVGIGSAFMHLKAEVNWHRLFMGMVDTFDAQKLEKNQIDLGINV